MNPKQGKETRQDRQVIEHRYVGCCWPDAGPRGVLFWAALLIVLGGVWLAGNLFGLEDWGRWLVSILFIAWGVGLLIDRGSGTSRRQG